MLQKGVFLCVRVRLRAATASLWVPVKKFCDIFSTTAKHRWNKQQATNPGPNGKELRANRNVTDSNSVGWTFSG